LVYLAPLKHAELLLMFLQRAEKASRVLEKRSGRGVVLGRKGGKEGSGCCPPKLSRAIALHGAMLRAIANSQRGYGGSGY
jgi:hypothetical protein